MTEQRKDIIVNDPYAKYKDPNANWKVDTDIDPVVNAYEEPSLGANARIALLIQKRAEGLSRSYCLDWSSSLSNMSFCCCSEDSVPLSIAVLSASSAWSRFIGGFSSA